MSHPSASAAATHIRDHRSVLARSEKRLLIAIASRLPPQVTSDHLSLLGFVSIVSSGAAFALMSVWPPAAWAVVICLILNWFGDSLDGTLARVRDQQRPRYGYYVDHVIDIAGTAALMTGVALSGLIHPVLAFALLSAYLLVSAESYLSTHAAGVFKMSFLGFGPTELRLVLIAGALKAMATPVVSVAGLGQMRLFDIGGAVALVGLAFAFTAAAAATTRRLYLEEPLPPRRSSGVPTASHPAERVA